jgi:hypothetical protein
VLLGAIVKVALDPAPFGVGRRHDPGPGGEELFGLLGHPGFEGFVPLSERGRLALDDVVEPAEFVAHPVEVEGQRPELVAVGHLDPTGEVSGGDLRQPGVDLLDGADER